VPTEMALDWSVIGGNPAPGDVGALENASREVQQVQEEATDHLQQVRGILAGWGGSGWSGASARRFETLLQGAEQHLVRMEECHQELASLLAGRAAELAGQQQAARQVLQEAEDAQARRQAASARQAEAQAEHAEAARAHARATEEISRIENAITSRVQQLEAIGTQVLGDLFKVMDAPLQSLLGEKQVQETARSAAQTVMDQAWELIGTMAGLIADAEADFRAALRQAEQVRAEVDQEAHLVGNRINQVQNGIHNLWHHAEQRGVSDGEHVVHTVEELLVGVGSAGATVKHTSIPRFSGSPNSVKPSAPIVVRSPAPSASEEAVNWAEKEYKSPSPQFSIPNIRCYTFVYQAYHAANPSDPPLHSYPTAQEAYLHYKATCRTTSPPPKGAIVFYSYTYKGTTYGHAAISIGTGSVICTQDVTGCPGVVKVPFVTPRRPATSAPPIVNSAGKRIAISYCHFEGWYLPENAS